MTDVFSQEEKATARRTKKRLFWSWFSCLAAAVLLIAAFALVDLYLVEAHRIRKYTFLFAFASGLIAIAVAFGSLFFFAIKYRLTRKYVRMLHEMDVGLKDTFEGKFLGYDDEITMKDGVYFYSMRLKTRPLRRDDIDERKLLIEQTVPKIELAEGDRLRIVSHANILVSYELLDTATKSAQTQDEETEREEKTE